MKATKTVNKTVYSTDGTCGNQYTKHSVPTVWIVTLKIEGDYKTVTGTPRFIRVAKPGDWNKLPKLNDILN